MRQTRLKPAGSRARSHARDLMLAQEEQNKALARELHDVVSQRLAAVKIQIDVLGRTPPRSHAGLRVKLRKLSGQVDELARTMHEISHQLHPAILEDLGLAAALKNECQIFSELYGNPVHFNSGHLPSALPDSVALCLYRIAQESLQNVARHAPGAAVSVFLGGGPGELALRIEDNGPGFRRKARRQGLGLVSMRERVQFVHGSLRVISKIGIGTITDVRVPVSAIRTRPRRAREQPAR